MLEQGNEIRTVQIITTGGTIEKTYDELDGTLDNKRSIIKEHLLGKLRLPYLKIEITPLMAMDSLHMTDIHRQLIAECVKGLLPLNEAIVILHGTDTMEHSARFLKEYLVTTNTVYSHPIIFTGAMRPLGLGDSDAVQNVTEALFATQLATPSVYVSFHGRLFDASFVRKNRQKRTFEAIT